MPLDVCQDYVGIIKLQMLPAEARRDRLPGVLRGLQDNENEKNWRYRNTLAE